MKKARLAILTDYLDWIKLAEEVEPLFGPMVEDPGFREALIRAIREENALCVTEVNEFGMGIFHGGIIISPDNNEILWLAVTEKSRGQGIGASLLSEAISHLDRNKRITVTTFDQTIKAGLPARRLYQQFGFKDYEASGLNPAGIPTVTMALLKSIV